MYPRIGLDGFVLISPGESGSEEFRFGEFCLVPSKRLLLSEGTPVSVGSRALDLLIVLLGRAGDLVSKEELMRHVWPDTHVVDGNLTVHIAALRRILKDGRDGRRYIVNVPGRGYRFVEPVTIVPLVKESATELPRHNLPSRLTRLIGRDPVIGHLSELLPRQRLATVTGPAGVGKCSVANSVAESLVPAYRDGAWRVDLATVTSSGRVPNAVATALGLDINSTDTLAGLVEALREKQLLLVLGNCDQVLEGAAALAVRLLEATPAVHVLTTSREPLQTEGEHIHRLAPLACPPVDRSLTAVGALKFPAVELFVECAAAMLGSYSLTDADAPVVAGICRKLDGIPLGIDLAAGRVDVLGVRALADRLCDDLILLAAKNRSADPRHQSMKAALDWSYALLSADQASVFRQIGMVVSPFTPGMAAALERDPDPERMANRLGELAAKSLLIAELDGAEPRFRMLEIVRKYALRKLAELGEFEVIAQRQAAYLASLRNRSAAVGG